MSKIAGKHFVEDELLKLASGVSGKHIDSFERSAAGVRRFLMLVQWKIDPRVHVSKTGYITLRFVDIGVSLTTFIFMDHDSVDYRSSMEREGVDYAPFCQGIDTQTNALNVIEAFGVKLFTH